MKHSRVTRNSISGLFFLIVFQIFIGTSLAQRDPSILSSRHYIGIEAGVNDSWLGGASSDFFFTYTYPYSDDPTNPVIAQLPFANLGSGIGFHIAATLDLSLTDFIGIQAKAFYRTNSMGNTEQRTFICTDITGNNPAPVTVEDNYKADLSFFAVSGAIRLQFVPKSFYGLVGLEYSSLLTNKFSGYEKIISTTNGCQYLSEPSGLPMLVPQTEIIIPEQTTANYFNSSQLGLKLGVGTFIPLGNAGHWVLTPELNLGIPLSAFFTAPFETAYKDGYPSNAPGSNVIPPNYAPTTTPKLWYVSFSVALKFPFGATSSDEMTSNNSGSSNTVNEPGSAHLKGRVTNSKTGDGVKANVTVVDLNSNEVVSESRTDGDGEFDVKVKAPGKYSVTADADGYLFGTAYFEVDDQGRILRGNHDIKLSPSETASRTRLLIFFDFDKADLQHSSYPELDRAVRLMKANPSMEVEIAGYTDSKGTDAYNHDLSHRRANTVRDYLINKGISADRIAAKGYGKDNPISTNDTEEGRADNRRVEFVVIKR